MLASTSAVQHRIGASALTAASPVIMPTFAEPNTAQRAKNFSLTSALIGRGVDRADAAGQGEVVGGDGDQGLAGPGGGGQHDVVAGDEFEDRLVLRRVELQALSRPTHAPKSAYSWSGSAGPPSASVAVRAVAVVAVVSMTTSTVPDPARPAARHRRAQKPLA